jgi:hypothetical protein
MGKINNVFNIPATIDGNFFRLWLEFLRPFHGLKGKELDVMATFLKERYTLSKVISDNQLLNKIVMNEDTKRKIRNECGITPAHFQVIMTKLRKSGMIVDGQIHPKIIPRLEENPKDFKLLIYFPLQ